MHTRLNGRLGIIVASIVWSVAMSEAVVAAEPPVNESALAGGIANEEKARIAALPEAELVALLKTGTRGQIDAAVGALVAKDKGDTLLAAAKAGPPLTSKVIIESYVPTATPESDAKAKAAVDAYLAWLEEQLKSDSPLVGPESAVRSLGRVAQPGPHEMGLDPTKPIPGGPRYQHQHVVGDLIGLLKDKRVSVSDAAAHWLGSVGGYTEEKAAVALAALEGFRQDVAAQPSSNSKEQKYQEMRVGWIDNAISRLKVERERRVRSAAIQAAATQPASAARPKRHEMR
jgi:hypothetical protein